MGRFAKRFISLLSAVALLFVTSSSAFASVDVLISQETHSHSIEIVENYTTQHDTLSLSVADEAFLVSDQHNEFHFTVIDVNKHYGASFGEALSSITTQNVTIDWINDAPVLATSYGFNSITSLAEIRPPIL